MLLLAARPAAAAWPSDPAVNLPVCTATNTQAYASMASDGVGGALIAWEDFNRAGAATHTVYVQRVRGVGSVDPAWPACGRAACAFASNQTAPVLVSDGAGGAIVVWKDDRNPPGMDLYAQHLLADGTLDLAWPAQGRAVCAAPLDQGAPAVIADGAGGAIVAWEDSRSVLTGADIYAGHVLANGTMDPAWPADGRALCTASDAQHEPHLVADGTGGAIVVWHDHRSTTNWDIYAQHVQAGGTNDPAWPANGRLLCSATNDQVRATIVSDGSAGAIVAWEDYDRPGTSGADVYAQHVLASGGLDPAWPPDGTAVCTALNDQVSLTSVSDGAHGALINWMDARLGTTDWNIYTQRVRVSGLVDPAWPVNGRALCTDTAVQGLPRCAPDKTGGEIVAWIDHRNAATTTDIYAEHIRVDGTLDPAWPVNGTPVTTAPKEQDTIALVGDGNGGAIIAWQDFRTDFNYDIYAQRVDPSGVLGGVSTTDVPRVDPLAPVLEAAWPNPVRGGTIAVRFTLRADEPASLELVDVAGGNKARLDVGSLGTGTHTVALSSARHLPPGLYFIRLRQGAVSHVVRVAVAQ